MPASDLQEKRNKRRAITLVGLVLIICAFVWIGAGDDSFQVDKSYYHNFDLKSIDRVLMESTTSGKVDLKYQGYRWRVNDTYNADRNLVEVLFATLQQAEPKRPVAESVRDSISKYLRTNGVKVSLFSSDKQIEQFYAGGDQQKSSAYFLKEGSNEPHVVIIPGYRVYVPGIFELSDLGWKDKLVFNFNWRNFKGLSARYKNSSGNFEVEMRLGEVILKDVPQPDTAKLNTYIDNISMLTVEEYLDQRDVPDSAKLETPFLDLTLEDIASKKYKMKVFGHRKQYFALIEEKDWALLAPQKIIPLLRPKEFFTKR